MVKKGIITESMTEQEIKDFLESDQTPIMEVPTRQSKGPAPTKKINEGLRTSQGKSKAIESRYSSSEETIYKRAVQQVAPDLDKQIDEFIAKARISAAENDNVTSRKFSSSSEDMFDTSDETDGNFNLVVGKGTKGTEATGASHDPTPEEHADQLIKDAEAS